MKNIHFNKITAALLLLVLSGCSYRGLRGYERIETNTGFKPSSWFSTDRDHMLLTASMDVMKHHFSGLMVIKPMAENDFRTVFMTETGIKIFDMEFAQGKPVQVYYLVEAMDKKVLVHTLEHDMGLALMLLNPAKQKNYVNESGNRMVMTKENGRKKYYSFQATRIKPSDGVQKTAVRRKSRVDFYSSDGMRLDSLNISHYHMRLNIKMKPVRDVTK